MDTVEVDRKPLSFQVEQIYLVLNKPTGYVTTVSDPHARHTVMDLIQGVSQRVYPVGRLDADSAGLLLFTNDGAFTERLTHPKHQVPKTYRTVVRGEVPAWAAADLRKGILLDDGMTAPAEVEWIDFDEKNNASIIDITIHEGRNRQVRRMFDAIGFPVLALTRMRIGPVQLKGIAPGTWRKLHPSEVKALLASADATPLSLPQTPTEETVEEPETTPVRSSRRENSHSGADTNSSRPERPAATARAKPIETRTPKKPVGDRPDPIRDAAKELASRLRSSGRDEADTPTGHNRQKPGRRRQ